MPNSPAYRRQRNLIINYETEHLGWAQQRVLVIDEDLGKSGTTAEGRPGFQRLVAEVSLEHVGIVLGLEMSRLARSNRDWHQLLEICALFDTLIADADGVYDPANYNDRLLLGLKGTISEAELHILKARMLEGRRAKARRGELGKAVPMGYLRRPSGEVVFDPDEQAQATIRRVFDLFERLRTVGKVMRYLIEHEGNPVSRKAMLEDVWNLHEDTDTRAIDNFIVRLRRYIEADPTQPRHLLTVRGVGYRFVASGG